MAPADPFPKPQKAPRTVLMAKLVTAGNYEEKDRKGGKSCFSSQFISVGLG